MKVHIGFYLNRLPAARCQACRLFLDLDEQYLSIHGTDFCANCAREIAKFFTPLKAEVQA